MSERIEIPVTGLRFPEGPRWRDGSLWVSDQLGDTVHRIEPEGRVSLVATMERPSGLGFLPDGDLLVASMVEPALYRVAVDGTVSRHTCLEGHAAFVNDMFVDERGFVYLDAYGPSGRSGDVLLIREGHVVVAASGLQFPNGIAITPDGSTLVVAETFASRVSAFEVNPDGSLSNLRVWISLPGRAPDGICLDAEGGVWIASYSTSEFLRIGPSGEITDTITVEGQRWAMACALGGHDGRDLYMCTAETDRRRYKAAESRGHLEITRVDVPGIGRP